MNDDHTEADVQEAIEIIRTAPQGSNEAGTAHAFICRLLEADLKQWIKEHPPTVLGPTSYAADDPHRAVILYTDSLLPNFDSDVIREKLYYQQALFVRCAKSAIKSLKTKSRKSVIDRITEKYPEYPELLKKIRMTKQNWTREDAQIKQGPSFRMMGGLARLGSRSGAEYSHLVTQAQKMETDVLGKTVTRYTRANG